MSNIQEKLKVDDKIMKALEATVIRRLICNTNKGVLELMVRKGETTYFLTLDSVPLEKELNDKLMGILFKPEVTVNKIEYEKFVATDRPLNETPIVIKKKGRPAKVK